MRGACTVWRIAMGRKRHRFEPDHNLPYPQGTKKLQIVFDDAELAAIDTWGFAKHIRARTTVIRTLVRKGLAAEAEAQRRDGRR
jgi:hypothetical protein